MPAAARTPRAGAAVIWAPCKTGQHGFKNKVTAKHTWPALVLDEAAEAWLDRALLRAPPVMLDTKVVEPTVVSKVLVPSVRVETMGAVRVVSGIEVAPATPLMPEMVVSPVTVLVTEPLVNVEVKVLVAIALASPAWLVSEPETVERKVVSKVWPSLVTVETTWETTWVLAAPAAEPDSETVETKVVSMVWPSLVMVETT